MAQLTKKALFYAHTLGDTKRIASVFAYAAYGLALRNPDPEKAPIIGLDALPATGKSTFVQAIIDKMLEGQPVIKNQSRETNSVGRLITQWRNYLSIDDGLQIRCMDSAYTGPYVIFPERAAKIMAHKDQVPDRHYPGLDFIEHTHAMPVDDLSCLVRIEKQDDGSRMYEISMPDDVSLPDEGLRYISDLVI